MTFDEWLQDCAIETTDADYTALELSRAWDQSLNLAIAELQKLRKNSVYLGYDEGWDDALDIAEQAIWGLRSS